MTVLPVSFGSSVDFTGTGGGLFGLGGGTGGALLHTQNFPSTTQTLEVMKVDSSVSVAQPVVQPILYSEQVVPYLHYHFQN